LNNFPYLPFIIFAGALITTATFGLPVFTLKNKLIVFYILLYKLIFIM